MSLRWIYASIAFVLVCLFSSPQLMFAKQAKKQIDVKQVKSSEKQENKLTKKLGGSERFLTLVSTDKPIYRANDIVFVRGVILKATDHRPMPDKQSVTATVRIEGSRGNLLSRRNIATENSVWGYKWLVPKSVGGGEYTVKVTYPNNGYAPAERKFDIRTFRTPRLRTQITFLREGYGPGERISATLEAKRAEGGIPQGAKVSVRAFIDGKEIKGQDATTDNRGLCSVSLRLPNEITKGEGTLALTVSDGGVVETASKTIPIILNKVDLKFYPEGGDLISGFENRLYIQANLSNGKPADLSGSLMWKQGVKTGVVANFRTMHEGRGRIEFTPDSNKGYFLSITEPIGINTVYPLPEQKTKGAVVNSRVDVFKKNQPINLKVGATEDQVRVSISKKEIEVASKNVAIKEQFKNSLIPVSFKLPAEIDGVLTVTVWDKDGIPLAERLIFREPNKTFKIQVTAKKKKYVPGDVAKITVKTTDENDNPISSVVGLTVTDDSVLEMIDKRNKAPRLPVMLYLEPEVEDLADAEVYLDPDNPKASLATDLLLGTQGWRRFALIDIDKFLKENGDNARRALAFVSKNRRMNLIQSQHRAVDRYTFFPSLPKGPVDGQLKLPEEIGRVEGPRDMNMFQVEPTVIDERHYTSGRAERHQKTSPTLPPGAPLPDGTPLSDVERKRYNTRLLNARIGQVSGWVMVREYAHKVKVGQNSDDRKDFTETLYWVSGLKTDPKTGEATISFGLSDNITTFKVLADGFTANGAVNVASADIESVQPFYVEAKIPLEVTNGDEILLPIGLVNSTDEDLNNLNLDINLSDHEKLPSLQRPNSTIAAGARVRWIQPIKVSSKIGEKKLILNANSGSHKDKVIRKLSVKPKGYPAEVAFGGVLEPEKSVIHKLTISDVVPGSMNSDLGIYPSPLANLTSSLKRLIKEPHGCFEQTCSTTYPLTMAQQYFMSHSGVDPKLIEDSSKKLEAGYKRLVSYWCPDRGYEWFGKNPGHEVLTAYGLLHFNDMKKVRSVDRKMMTTTRAWLLKQKDGNGGFKRTRKAFDHWSADKNCTDAYVVWALLESGQPTSDLRKEIDTLKKKSASSKNSYVMALAANALHKAGEKNAAKNLMVRLSSKQLADGSLKDIKGSVVGSNGKSLKVEGTALATLAWLKGGRDYEDNVDKAINYLAKSCKGGSYGSTQSTVLALKAIVEYDKQKAHPKEPGKVRVYVDDQAVGDWIVFNTSTRKKVKLPDLSELLTPGEHKVKLVMQGGSAMPYSYSGKFNANTPASAKNCKMNISVSMPLKKVVEGAATEAKVVVSNVASEVVPSPIAIVGIPGGLEPRHDQLKELVKKGKIAAYEVIGRELVFYWRGLPAKAKVEFPISLIATIPGKYSGPASRAYLYYANGNKNWVRGLEIEIAAKDTAPNNVSVIMRK